MSKEKPKKSPILLYIVAAIMIVIFIIQQVFPANFGEEFNEFVGDAACINVTVTENGTGVAYETEDAGKINEYRDYISGIKLHIRTLGDSMSMNKKELKKYTFTVIAKNGDRTAVFIDERGLVQMNTRVFKLGMNIDEFFEHLDAMLKTWEWSN